MARCACLSRAMRHAIAAHVPYWTPGSRSRMTKPRAICQQTLHARAILRQWRGAHKPLQRASDFEKACQRPLVSMGAGKNEKPVMMSHRDIVSVAGGSRANAVGGLRGRAQPTAQCLISRSAVCLVLHF